MVAHDQAPGFNVLRQKGINYDFGSRIYTLLDSGQWTVEREIIKEAHCCGETSNTLSAMKIKAKKCGWSSGGN